MKKYAATLLALIFLPVFVSLAVNPADRDRKPLKVFILMGQSNMVGFGAVGADTVPGSLAYLAANDVRYRGLRDGNGQWKERNDVWCVKTTVGQKQGPLKPGFGAGDIFFGPEYPFGQVIGDDLEEPVLLIKASQGNRSLGWDILPPGSRRFEYGGKIYAGYRDSTGCWKKGESGKKVNWYAGKQYDDFVRDIHEVLDDLHRFYPEYRGQGYEIAGFVWWQGHKDQALPYALRYEQNLVRFIKTVRKEFRAPKAPFVLATIGFWGWNMKEPGLTVARAQLAVSGESGKYPSFKGNVKTVEARGYWREKEVSPNQRQDYHYFHNAETYMEVGTALGKAMVELLDKDQ